MGISVAIQIGAVVYLELLRVLRVYSRDKLVKEALLIIDIRVINDLGNEFLLILRTTKIKVRILRIKYFHLLVLFGLLNFLIRFEFFWH